MATNLPSGLPEEHEKKSTLTPILIALLCSFLLAGGSCFAALRTFKYNHGGGAWWFVFMAFFLAATLAFVVVCLLLIVRAFRGANRKKG
jgi:uncharacterized membrane protein